MRRCSALRYGRIGRLRTWCIGYLTSPFARMNVVFAWDTGQRTSPCCAISHLISYVKKPDLRAVSNRSDTVLAGMTRISRMSYRALHDIKNTERTGYSHRKRIYPTGKETNVEQLGKTSVYSVVTMTIAPYTRFSG